MEKPKVIDCSFEQYCEMPYVNHSLLKALGDRTPAHALSYLNEPNTPTNAMALGTMIHAAVLEPDKFAKNYVGVSGDGRTKAVKDTKKAVREAGQIPVPQSDMETTARILANLSAHNRASALLGLVVLAEKTLTWIDPETQVACKARIDGIVPAARMAFDLKTSNDISERAIEKSIVNFDWDTQGAWYLDGLQICLPDQIDHFVHIVCETDKPNLVRVVAMDDATFSMGRFKNKHRLATIGRCMTREIWPGYPDDEIRSVAAPEWAFARATEEIQKANEEGAL